MYLRVDPSKSASNDLFIMDKDDSINELRLRDSVTCSDGSHYNIPAATLVDKQNVHCVDNGSSIYTLIYQI